jgi:dTDP-4-amino-4,6-dideoxygalactose transaminase
LIHYPVPPHLSEAYTDARIAKGTLPLAEAIAATTLSLPGGPKLMLGDAISIIRAMEQRANFSISGVI